MKEKFNTVAPSSFGVSSMDTKSNWVKYTDGEDDFIKIHRPFGNCFGIQYSQLTTL
jgi:hypothetical protein